MLKKILIILILAFFSSTGFTQKPVQLALLKYKGGGDWYANPSSLPNLIAFCNEYLNMDLNKDYQTVEPGSPDIFNYPLLHMTGHGNVVFSTQEADNLREYLISGGFLHIDDNYGMDPYIRPEMKKVFPELDFMELSFDHPIYHQKYEFKDGLPKIHEHDKKPPQGFGLIYEGRLICFYTYECDLGDGWEDTAVHNDSREKRIEAFKMGANIIQYVFSN